MGTDHDLRAELAAWTIRLERRLTAITDRLDDIEARLDDLETLTDTREAA